MNKVIKTKIAVTSVAVALMGGIVASLAFLPSHSASAVTDDSIMRKVAMNGISYCYGSGAIKQKVDAQYFSINSAVEAKGTIYIPSSLGTAVNCRQLFEDSIPSVYGGKKPSRPEDLGYNLEAALDSNEAKECLNLTYTYDGSQYTTEKLCAYTIDGVVQSMAIEGSAGATGGTSNNPTLYITMEPLGVYSSKTATMVYEVGGWSPEYTKWSDIVSKFKNTEGIINSLMVPMLDEYYQEVYITPYSNASIKTEKSNEGATEYQQYIINSYSEAAKKALQFYTGSTDFGSMKFNSSDDEFVLNSVVSLMASDGTIVPLGDCQPGKKEAMETASKAGDKGYVYHNKETNNWCPVQLVNDNKQYNIVDTSTMTKLKPATAKSILGLLEGQQVGYESSAQACNSKALSSRRAAQNLINQSTTSEEYRNKARRTLEELDNILRKTGTYGKTEPEQMYWYRDNDGNIQCYTYTEPDGQESTPPGSTTNPGQPNDPGPDEDTTGTDQLDIAQCKKSTSLGWVICPALSLIGSALNGMYEQLANQWLVINASEVSTSSPLYESWKTFRDYANIGFAILFAIVVFSQVTGFGLSNYSIKKMLPTLIMVAVLVNVSFFICQLAVDATNIVGVAIGNVLETIGNGALENASSLTGMDYAKGVTVSLLSAAGIGGLAYAGGVVLLPFIGATVIIPVILGLVGALIGYFFLLILLALRKAILYIEILLAPLAFIAYALPNTKSLFDKWKKLFINLLLVFPICQALVSGGQMIAKVMMSSDQNGFFFQFTAMLMQIVPIFFIPMVLRSSMSMLGNIGAKVSQMGAKMSHGAKSVAGNSQIAKRAGVAMNRWGANKIMNRKGFNKSYKAGSLRGALQKNSRARVAQSLMAAEDLRKGDRLNENITSGAYMGNLMASNDYKADEEMASNYASGLKNNQAISMVNGEVLDPNDLEGQMVDELEAAMRANDQTTIKGLIQHLMTKGDKGLTTIKSAMKRDGIAFNSDGTMMSYKDARRSGFNTAARYMAANDKWGMLMKRWDPNTNNLIQQGAQLSDKNTIDKGHNRAYYMVGANDKIAPAQVPNLGDSFRKDQEEFYGSDEGMRALMAEEAAYDSGSVDSMPLHQALEAYNTNVQEAYDNPRIYSQMGGALRDTQAVYEAQQKYAALVDKIRQEDIDYTNKAALQRAREEVDRQVKAKLKKLAPQTTLKVQDHRTDRQRYNDEWGDALD